MIYFAYWTFGSVVYFVAKKDFLTFLSSKKLVYIFLFLVFISASITRLRFLDKIVGDGFISFSVALLIFSLIKHDIIKDSKILVFFTNISYSLYAVHLPIIIFIVSIFPYFKLKLQPAFGNSLLSLAVLLVTILMSWLFYLVFEKNTNFIKSKFIKYINK